MADTIITSGTLLDEAPFSVSTVVTGTETLVLERGSSLTLFVTATGNAATSIINLGIQTEYQNTGNYFDLSLISTDFDGGVAPVTPYTFQFEGDTAIAVRIPVDVSGASRVRVTGQANDSAGSLNVRYRLTTQDATGEVG